MTVRPPRSPCAAWTVAAVMVATAAAASTQQWEPYPPGVGGPWGGSVRRVVSPGSPTNLADPLWGTLWAATGGGVYRSTDGGATWTSRSTGLQGLDVTDIDVCRADPQRLIASTATQGVHLSSDGGATWTRVDRFLTRVNNLPQDRFFRVAVNPSNPSHLFAATFQSTFNLLESTNGGAAWTDLGAFSVNRLRFGTDGNLYFGTQEGRVFRYGPADTPPRKISFFLDALGRELSPSPAVSDFALPGGTGQTVAAAAGGSGIWVTIDGGATWQELHFQGAANPDFHEVDAVAADPADASRVLYHLNDPLAGAATALYDLPLGGGTRTALALPESSMETLGVFATPAAEWLLENKAGLFRRVGRAGAFSHSSRGLAAFCARDVAFAPTAGALAVAGGGLSSGNGGAYRWDPAGGAWVRLAAKPTDPAGTSFPAASTVLARYRGAELWLGVEGWGLYRSLDAGQTWEDRSLGLGTTAKREIFGLEFSSAEPSRAIVGTLAGVYLTTDGGANWAGAAAIPPTTGWPVARDVGNASRFFAAGKQGNDGLFFRTSDGGASWAEPLPGAFAGMQLNTLAASSRQSGHLLAGTALFGLFETFDGGGSWVPLGGGASGLPGAGEINALAIADQLGDPWMTAVANRSVYVTLDGGASWSARNQGLALPNGSMNLIYAVRFEPGAARLVAAVNNRGLWYLDLFPRAELSGAPASPTSSRGATIGVAGAEIDAYRSSLDGAAYGAEAPVTQALSLTGLGDGLHRVEVVGRNAAGAWQPTTHATAAQWTVDGTPPTGSVTINGGAAATVSASVTLSLAATDALTGVTGMRFSNDGAAYSATEPLAASKSWTLSPGDGTKTVYVRFADGAGNVATVTDTILLDTTIPDTEAPSGTVTIAAGASATATASVTLALSASDDRGGPVEMCLGNDSGPCSAWEALAASKAWTLAAGDGQKTVYAWFRDEAGNVSVAASDAILLDVTAPTGGVTVNGGAATTTTANVTLALSASDGAGSGVVQMCVSNDAGTCAAWEAFAASRAWTLTAGPGVKTVYVQFRDAVGHVSPAASDTVELTDPPPAAGGGGGGGGGGGCFLSSLGI